MHVSIPFVCTIKRDQTFLAAPLGGGALFFFALSLHPLNRGDGWTTTEHPRQSEVININNDDDDDNNYRKGRAFPYRRRHRHYRLALKTETDLFYAHVCRDESSSPLCH